jgi:hypothetical protein
MDSSVFERLAERFADCRAEIQRGDEWRNRDMDDVMRAAGETLFTAIAERQINLGDVPDWLRDDPKGTVEGPDCKGGEIAVTTHDWDWYWLAAITWLSQKPGSGLTRPFAMFAARPQEHFGQGLSVVCALQAKWCRLEPQRRQKDFLRFATLSMDACRYLGGMLTKPGESGQEQPKPDAVESALQIGDNAFRRYGERGYLVRFQGGKPEIIARRKGDLPGLDQTWVLLQREAEYRRNPSRIHAAMTDTEVQEAESHNYLAKDDDEHSAAAQKRLSESAMTQLATPERRLDDAAMHRIEGERQRLQATLDDETADPGDLAEAHEQLERLNEAVRRDTKPGPQGRPQSKKIGTIKADSIRTNIDRAIEAIGGQEPALARHLKAFIKHTTAGHIYAPDVHINWDLG